MKLIRSLFVTICVIAVSLGGHAPVIAQTAAEPTGFQQVTLFLQPEYDQPGLLVMIQGQIVGAQAPATVKFLVPTGAVMNSAGSIDSAGNYTGGPPARAASTIPGWDEISYEVTTQTFHVEYYDSSIIGYPNKTIAYEFIPEYPVTGLYVHIQQPASSTNFTVSPVGQLSVDSQGYNWYTYTVSSLNAQATLSYNISYTKTDTRVSTVIMAKKNLNSLPFIIIPIALGVVLLAVILIRRRKLIFKSRRRQSPRAKAVSSKGNQAAAGFCRQCGEEIEGPFLFCPYCGAKRAAKNTRTKSV